MKILMTILNPFITATGDLKGLVEKRVLILTGKGRRDLRYLFNRCKNGAKIKVIKKKTYCTICKVEKTIAHKELSDLVEKNLIERRGKGRSSHYVLRTKRAIIGRLADN